MNLNQAYSRDIMLQIAYRLDKFFQKDIRSFEYTSDIFRNAYYLGNMPQASTDVIEIEVNGDIKNRVAITKEAYKLLKSISSPHAIISFYSTNGSKRWRLSLLTTDYEIVEGKVIANQSNPRRFSYLLGDGAKIVTPMKYLIDKGNLVDFNDLKSRFSMEVVNKEFYEKIALLFTKLVGGKRKVGRSYENFEGLLSINGIISPVMEHQEFAVRLIGRLLFAWFLKEKKSSNKIPLISDEVLSLNAIKKSKDYYHDVLEILFFEILNTKLPHRRLAFNNVKFKTIPYLNGGLFSPHKTDYYIFDNTQKPIMIPNIWFEELFEIFETYNFTVDENTSFDIELSIDPEMLGRIFENLLAEINPDTGESARKSTGSFYTPRYIVEYMVNQSINAYLKTSTQLSTDQINYITSDNFGFDEQVKFSESEKRYIIRALQKVKILDPACGSGAFPIGLLQRIIHIVTIIDPDASMWNEAEFKNLSPEFKQSLIDKYAKSGFGYPRKLQIIRESIFGVDIQPIATEISRLRCFLTLIVDEVVDDEEENRGIKALPNLEFKFVTANSLARLEGNAKIKKIRRVGMLDEEEYYVDLLQQIRNEYFVATSENRGEIQRRFIDTQREMEQKIKDGKENLSTSKFNRLIEWNPFSEKVSDWLDTEWMFGTKAFDIVIQNPPYVSTKNITANDKKMLDENYGYVDDLYNHFIRRGLEFLKPEGIQTVISSDTYFTTITKKELREYILNRYIHSIVSLGYNVFETAMVSTAIILIDNKLGNNKNLEFFDAENSDDIISAPKYIMDQSIYKETINNAIFVPNERNMSIHDKIAKYWKFLDKNYGGIISTSKNIEKHKHLIKDHVDKIKEERHTLVGLVTEGGQGLATANNGKYVGVIDGTKEAERIRETRPNKLVEVNKQFKLKHQLPLEEKEVWSLFDGLKEKYGRDIFGQGYLYRIVDKTMIADVKTLSDTEKESGIANDKPYFVPYDKGDKDGNRWYLDNPYVIGWSKRNVSELKKNAGKKGKGSSRFQNPQFYFREGFCYSDVNSTYLKARLKPESVYDVTSMSFFSTTDKVPNYYIISLINSELIAWLVDAFLNNTSHFQINDCRFLPIPVPTKDQLNACKRFFDEAVETQKDFFDGIIGEAERDKKLSDIQKVVDDFALKVYKI
ncbi:BREX-1 system adenine-specific DNA-methyltransferase PglX [Acholeplasma laidlawii]|uniref:BREX-1 system adenine-specific DNA-methyltransferase PglX n=1 Tax=Acholeplasma laidlawii TaxID=2148 RepID=UPI0021F6A133|nr:BREX-1 system adenine-specific DNA-methyltransferase PglX [Acholeplasma laidlawii]